MRMLIFRSTKAHRLTFSMRIEDLWVAEYPARVAYDDWYEGSVGAENLPDFHPDEIHRRTIYKEKSSG